MVKGKKYYLGQEITYDGRNFILTSVQQGKEGNPYVIINNGWSIKDPFARPVKGEYPNANVLGFYYKLSDPEISEPKRTRVKRLLKKHPEYFGCQGLESSGKELKELLEDAFFDEKVLLVGFTKSATMMLLEAFPKNVEVIAVCPILTGTYLVMPDVMKKYLKSFYPLVSWILTEHIVDEDIAVGSEYLKKRENLAVGKKTIFIATLDQFSKCDERWNIVDCFFSCISPLMEDIIKKETGKKSIVKSNGFLSYETQVTFCPNISMLEIYASMPMALYHPDVETWINRRIRDLNRKNPD